VGDYSGVIGLNRRTDLALEAKELWEESAGETTELPGVEARESERDGVRSTTVRVLDERGEKALGKPAGTYVTLELRAFNRREHGAFRRSAEALGRELKKLLALGKDESVLVAGLGNAAVTPDAVGPKVLSRLMVTRHLVEQLPSWFSGYRPVSAVAPGVLGVTGIESVELIAGVLGRLKPDRLIVVDALASRRLDRVGTTIQLADTGITPGSGVGNAREAFSRESLGLPVCAVGVPTVVDVETLLADLSGDEVPREELDRVCGGQSLIVTPRDIDARVERVAKLMAYGINLAVQPGVKFEDVEFFVE